MSRVIERTWAEVEQTLRNRDSVPAAQGNADLLADARPSWEGRVLPDLHVDDLRFVAPGDTREHVDEVCVSWDAEVYILRLRDHRGLEVARDFARTPTAVVSLDLMLAQLVGDPKPGD